MRRANNAERSIPWHMIIGAADERPALAGIGGQPAAAHGLRSQMRWAVWRAVSRFPPFGGRWTLRRRLRTRSETDARVVALRLPPLAPHPPTVVHVTGTGCSRPDVRPASFSTPRRSLRRCAECRHRSGDPLRLLVDFALRKSAHTLGPQITEHAIARQVHDSPSNSRRSWCSSTHAGLAATKCCVSAVSITAESYRCASRATAQRRATRTNSVSRRSRRSRRP